MFSIKKLIHTQIYRKIKVYNEIVIARHVSPDPDAWASQMALKESILITFPSKKVYAVGISVARFKNYGKLDKVNFKELQNPLLIVLDVPNFKRIDGIDGLKYQEIIKIDHHPAEDIDSACSWTDEKASSTCQMIAELIMNTRLKLNAKIARNLFLGIVSDSDRFVLRNTSITTFKITYQLLKQSKISFIDLYDELYLRPFDEIKFYAYITNNLKVTPNGLGYIEIPPKVFIEYKVDPATAANIINRFNFIEELLVWVFITYEEKAKCYKVNLRSRGPIINLVAGRYQGGGHKFACGVRLTDQSAITALIKDLDVVCANYKEVTKLKDKKGTTNDNHC